MWVYYFNISTIDVEYIYVRELKYIEGIGEHMRELRDTNSHPSFAFFFSFLGPSVKIKNTRVKKALEASRLLCVA